MDSTNLTVSLVLQVCPHDCLHASGTHAVCLGKGLAVPSAMRPGLGLSCEAAINQPAHSEMHAQMQHEEGEVSKFNAVLRRGFEMGVKSDLASPVLGIL